MTRPGQLSFRCIRQHGLRTDADHPLRHRRRSRSSSLYRQAEADRSLTVLRVGSFVNRNYLPAFPTDILSERCGPNARSERNSVASRRSASRGVPCDLFRLGLDDDGRGSRGRFERRSNRINRCVSRLLSRIAVVHRGISHRSGGESPQSAKEEHSIFKNARQA
jgi:hypothetical protein